MSRRGNGEGAVDKKPLKDGRWRSRLRLSDGTRKAFYGKNKREAQRKLTVARLDAERGVSPGKERYTIEECLTAWLKVKEQKQLKPGTLQRYRSIVRVHLIKPFGQMRLARLQPEDLEALYQAKLDAGLSTMTVAHIHLVIQQAISLAVRRGHARQNVAKLVEGKPGVTHKEREPFSMEEVQTFMRAVRENRLAAFYQLALTTGMRESEILGLSWQDVDWNQGEVRIRQQLKYGHEVDGDALHFFFGTPKTQKSKRFVPLAPSMVEALRQHQERQLFEQKRLGNAWENCYNLVFCTSKGLPIDANNLRKRQYYKLLEKAGLRRITLHDLRHSFTSHLRKDTNDKHVSDFLGHVTTDQTDAYTHLTPDVKAAMVEKIERLFWAV